MGWTSLHTESKNKKEVMIKELEQYGHQKVIDSAMVGNTFYGAIQDEYNGEKRVWAIVCLIRINNQSFYNFSYKDMCETTGPFQYKCPKRIIKLLTPIDSEWANNWRKKCLEPKQESTITRLNKLPIGTVVEYVDYNGEKTTIIKREPCYQFKNDWWQLVGERVYIKKKSISANFKIIERGREYAKRN